MARQVRISRPERVRKVRATQAVRARQFAAGERGLRPRSRVHVLTEPVEDRRS
jgi:hypothetical protein